MRLTKNFQLCLSVAIVCLSSASSAQTWNYNPQKAVDYAYWNYQKEYHYTSSPNKPPGTNPFQDYGYVLADEGGNCTNYVSQAIMAGLTNQTDPIEVYADRYDFDVDRYSTGFRWFFLWDSYNSGYGQGRGEAWTGAHHLFEYADGNQMNYKGLHFSYVTEDTPSSWMDVNAVSIGDIIFADWNHDGHIDHSMIVTAKYGGGSTDYSRIRVTYQSVDLSEARRNRSLAAINASYGYQAIFRVYRPVNYSTYGL